MAKKRRKARTSAKVRPSRKVRSGSKANSVGKDSPQGWRATLPIHPAAELFPLMSPAELEELAFDITENGLVTPIALWRPDPDSLLQLLDGRNRLDALFNYSGAGWIRVDPPNIETPPRTYFNVVQILDSSIYPYAYVISANIKRRHLNVEQRQQLLIALIARAPEKSDRQIGKEIGVDHKTVATARAKGEDVGSVPHVETRTDTKGRKQPGRKGGGKGAKRGRKRNVVISAGGIDLACCAEAPKGGDVVGENSAGETERLRALALESEDVRDFLDALAGHVASMERERREELFRALHRILDDDKPESLRRVS